MKYWTTDRTSKSKCKRWQWRWWRWWKWWTAMWGESKRDCIWWGSRRPVGSDYWFSKRTG